MDFSSAIMMAWLVALATPLYAIDNTELLPDDGKMIATEYSYQTFASCDALEETMSKILTNSAFPYQGGWRGGFALDAEKSVGMATAAPQASREVQQSTYSETNVQVAWIDEADTVKTDGKYLYSYQEWERAIVILDAKTLEKKQMIRIPMTYYGVTFYVQGNRLVLTATRSIAYSPRWYGWYNNEQRWVIAIYDISNPSKVSLIRTTQVNGSVTDSRLSQDGILTVVLSNYFWLPPIYYAKTASTVNREYSERSLIPSITDTVFSRENGVKTSTKKVADCASIGAVLPVGDIAQYNYSPSLTMVLRYDTKATAGAIDTKLVLSDNGQIHLSNTSLYLTTPIYTPGWSMCPPWAMCIANEIWNPENATQTLIHRFGFRGTSTNYVYSATIPGNPLNQYSMDEDANGNFRIVTHEWGTQWQTRVTVLDPKWNTTGALTAIAPGENFQSARFIGNRLYLVTFEQIDPLFVIDMSEKNPKILGELKIPWYSTYLHPYDTERLIGVGYATMTGQWGGVQNGGIKIDLYNVADVKNPKQESTLTLGDDGSYSEVLYNPRAFVWYKEKWLLLLPATIMKQQHTRESYVPQSGFQGLLGIAISSSGWVKEVFRVTHIMPTTEWKDRWLKDCAQYTGNTGTRVCHKLMNGGEYCEGTSEYVPPYCYADATLDSYIAGNLWNFSDSFITRALYIGEQFYTISNAKIAKWSFSDTSKPLGEIPFKTQNPISYPLVSPSVIAR